MLKAKAVQLLSLAVNIFLLLLFSMEAPLFAGAARQCFIDLDVFRVSDVHSPSHTYVADFTVVMYYQDPRYTNFTDLALRFSTTPVVNVNLLPSAIPIAVSGDKQLMIIRNFVDQQRMISTKYALRTPPAFAATHPNVDAAFPGIWMQHREEHQVKLQSIFDMKEFPYDLQSLLLILQSPTFNTSELEYQFVDRNVPFTGDIAPTPGWDFVKERKWIRPQYYRLLDNHYTRMTVSMTFERKPAFYVWFLITGMTLLSFMNECLFLLPVAIAPRHAAAATLFLVTITYALVVTQDVPKVTELTRMHYFIVLTMFHNFLCYVLLALHTYVMKNEEINKHWLVAEGWFQGTFTRILCLVMFVSYFTASSVILSDWSMGISTMVLSLFFVVIGAIIEIQNVTLRWKKREKLIVEEEVKPQEKNESLQSPFDPPKQH